MNKKIAINGRFLTQRLTGVQRYAIETVQAMDTLLAAGNLQMRPTCELLVPSGCDWPHGELSVITVRQVGVLQGHAWEQLELPCSVGPGTVLLNLCNAYPVLARRFLVTVHDASIYAMPEGYTRAFIMFYRILFGLLRLRKKVPILTDSRFSALELQQFVGLPPERLNVIHCGADHWAKVTPDDTLLERLGLGPGSYVLAVASENPNKNLTRLVDAFSLLGLTKFKLVLVGGRNAKVFAAGGHPDPDWIIRAGAVSDAELAALYSSAICFAFPSLYEGFGLPPLEAMRFSCPVMSSNEASLPEICGDAALYCDGLDVSSIAAGLLALLSDGNLRRRLIQAGHLQVEKFKWQQTAAAVLQQIEAYPI